MPFQTTHLLHAATNIRHGLLRKLNTSQPWWPQKHLRIPTFLAVTLRARSPAVDLQRLDPALPVTAGVPFPRYYSTQTSSGLHPPLETTLPLEPAISDSVNPVTSDLADAHRTPTCLDSGEVGKVEDTPPSLSTLPRDVKARKLGETKLPAYKMTDNMGEIIDPEGNNDIPAEEEEVKEALSRPPPVNSDYLPLPWKGRLGYVSRNPMSVFSLGF